MVAKSRTTTMGSAECLKSYKKRTAPITMNAKTDQARFLVVARHSAPAGGDVLLHISKVLQHGSLCPFRVFFFNGSVDLLMVTEVILGEVTGY